MISGKFQHDTSCSIITRTLHNADVNQIKEYELGGESSTHGRNEKYENFYRKTWREETTRVTKAYMQWEY